MSVFHNETSQKVRKKRLTLSLADIFPRAPDQPEDRKKKVAILSKRVVFPSSSRPALPKQAATKQRRSTNPELPTEPREKSDGNDTLESMAGTRLVERLSRRMLGESTPTGEQADEESSESD